MYCMAFKFKLEKILKIRHEAVQEILAKIQELEKKINETRISIKLKHTQIKTNQEEMIESNYQFAEEYLRVLKKLNKEFEKLHEDLARYKKDRDQAQKDLLDARMKAEALEKLKEKQAEEYYEEENRIEQLETDEKVSLKFATDILKRQLEEEEDDEAWL